MKYFRKNIILYYLFFAMLLIFTSCENDKEDYSLYESVWIHQFKPEDNIMDGVDAVALVFGKRNVEYYTLDANKKAMRLIRTCSYTIKNKQIIFGNNQQNKNNIDSYRIYFDLKYFYKSSKTPGDIFP